MHDETLRDEFTETTPPSLFDRWGWPICGLMALILFEWTTNLVWSSMVFALRFGWRDSYAGGSYWLRDATAGRGWAILLMHLAAATSKIFIAGIGMMFAIAILAQPWEPGAPEIDTLMTLLAIIFIGGMMLSTACCLASILICRRSGRRIWIDSESYAQYTAFPFDRPAWTTNRCRWIVSCAMIFVLFIGVVLTICLPLIFLNGKPGPNQASWFMLGFFSMILGNLAVFFYGREWAVRSVAAEHPHDCWHELLSPDNADWMALITQSAPEGDLTHNGNRF